MATDDANASFSGILLAGRIEILPSTPLPEFDSPGGSAYAARLRSDPSSSLFAIVCLSTMPPRLESVQSMRNLDSPYVLRLVEAGVITWLNGIQAYALVYQKPSAPRLNLDEPHPPLSEDVIKHQFVAPMIGALLALGNLGIAHNAISPKNVFWRIGTAQPPQIGDCLSFPAGAGQSVLFEPVNRALASPLGRGIGIHEDDCYAFGVMLALLVIGRNPLQGLSDAEIVDQKMQKGSFGAIVGNSRISPTHIELLRGLLADDPGQRWTAVELDQWINGRRMTPKSSDAGLRAGRAFEFMGKEYWFIGPLAHAMANNPAEAAKIIEDESLLKWLRRALSDKERDKDVDEAIKELKQTGRSTNFEDQLVARVCIALHPSAPIRYRGVSALPNGIPQLLVDAVINNGNVQVLSEIIGTQLVSLWIRLQREGKADFISLGQMFDRMKSVIEKSSYGNGVERAIYESNASLPCLSPMLRNQYVASSKALLPAMERVAASPTKGREPMDRHIAAFLIVRERRSENAFAAMSLPDNSPKRALTLLALYSDIQYRNGPESLPQLASWLSLAVDPALNRYFSKTLREGLQKRAKEAVAAGNLSELYSLIDDPKRLARDQQDFYAARLLYLNIQKEIIKLESRLNDRNAMASSGKPLAASISSLLAIILVCAALLKVFVGSFIASL